MNQAAAAQTWLATIALLAWPAAACWFYSTRPVTQATLWTILGGYLLLPVNASIKLAEGIPQLDKVSIPALAALAGCLFAGKRPVRFFYGLGLTEVLLVVFLIGPFITSLQNADPVMSGAVLLPGVGAYDGLSAVVSQFLFALPFFLGRQFLRKSADVEEILRTLVIAGLLYSLPVLFEIRMSPQLHYWVYGYYPSEFLQQMRYGGFRPMVFIGHGLGVAFFAMITCVAATALWRTRTRVQQFSPIGVWGYLCVILILCKGAASVVYCAGVAPLIRFTTPRLQLRVATVLVAVAMLYPVLRTADLVPTDELVAAARTFNDERADSLKFRFDHEKELLERASQRIFFGWGRFGRNRIYDEWGKDISVSDGHWVLTLGQFGVLGFAAEFGLLALTVFRARTALKLAESDRDRIFAAALALIVAVSMIDLLPDATITPLTWLFAGALLGRVEGLRAATRRRPQNNNLSTRIQFPDSANSQGDAVHPLTPPNSLNP